jgi:UDP-hydrolysing UDP-N-acetyl-D-glucosamine 2-epimerase
MARRKVCVVVTARSSYSRIKTALRAITDHPDLELQVVVAASALLDRYGSAVEQVRSDGFPVDREIFMVLEGETPTATAKTTGLGLLELATAFDNLAPDVVVTVADRYETVASAVGAAYMNIPLAHVQGGEVTGSIDEKVRHAVTKLADLHLVSTEWAAERVIRMGENPDTVFVTGCPSIDLAAEILDSPKMDFDPFERYGGVGASFDLSGDYLVVLQHPVTTEYEKARAHVTETLHAVDELGLPTLWFWPNVDAGSDGTSRGIRVFREQRRPENIRFFKNMAPSDFLRVVYNSRAIVGNSSMAIRECSFLAVPAVNIGNRQAGRERGTNVVDVGYDRSAIAGAIKELGRRSRPGSDLTYGDAKAGPRVAERLAEAELRYDKKLAY